MISWKNKKTGEIIKFVGKTSSLKNTTINFRNSNGDLYEILEENFIKEYEPVQVDFQKFQVELVEFCKSTRGLKNVLEAVLRKYHPGGYFHEGDKVFITDAPLLFSSDITGPRCYTTGPNYPFVVHKIERLDIDRFKIYIERTSINLKHYVDCSLCFDAWADRIVPLDAFWTLQRYDQPY